MNGTFDRGLIPWLAALGMCGAALLAVPAGAAIDSSGEPIVDGTVDAGGLPRERPASGPLIPFKTGDHDGFSRLVFRPPVGTLFSVHKYGEELVIGLSTNGRIDLPALKRRLPQLVGDARIRRRNKRLEIVLLIPGGAEIRHYREGDRVVVDILSSGPPALGESGHDLVGPLPRDAEIQPSMAGPSEAPAAPLAVKSGDTVNPGAPDADEATASLPGGTADHLPVVEVAKVPTPHAVPQDMAGLEAPETAIQAAGPLGEDLAAALIPEAVEAGAVEATGGEEPGDLAAGKPAEPAEPAEPAQTLKAADASPDVAPDVTALDVDVDRFTQEEEEFIVVRLLLEDIVLTDEFFGYARRGSLVLPLRDLADLLEFAITVDDENGTASGWFLSESRNFDLDVGAGTVNVNGRKYEFPRDLVRIVDDDIYVDTALLSTWFPLDFDAALHRLDVKVLPRETLPLQARLARADRRKNINEFSEEEISVATANMEQELISVPMLTFSIREQATGSRGSPMVRITDYSILGQGDLGKMTANMVVGGSEEKVKTFRLTMSKVDPTGNMLGPFRATRVAVGDITPPAIPYARSLGQERGITIGNSDIFTSRLFDTTRISGDLEEGWEIEVYHNKLLIDSAVVGPDGRYDFFDLPLFYGTNNFEVVYYGPQGQRRAETKSLHLDASLLRSNKAQYQVSLSQQGRSLTDFGSDRNSDDDKFRFVGQFSKGMTKNMSVLGGFSSTTAAGERYNYLNLGTAFTMDGLFGRLDWTYDGKSGNALQAVLQKSLGPLSLRLKHQHFLNFLENPNSPNGRQIDFRSEAGLFGAIPGKGFLPSIPFTFSGTMTQASGITLLSLGNRLSTHLFGVTWTNSLFFNRFKGLDINTTRTTGTFQASRSIRRIVLRSLLEYQALPAMALRSARLVSSWNVSRDLNIGFNLIQTFSRSKRTTGSLNISWNLGGFIITPSASYDSDKSYSASIQARFTLGREPRSGRFSVNRYLVPDTGAVSARVFLDNNNNLLFDEGDEPLPEVKIQTPRGRRQSTTDDDGIAFLTGLDPTGISKISVDPISLEDPFWVPMVDNKIILPRPGFIELVDIPITVSGEIDGSLYLTDRDIGERPMGNVNMQLLNSEGNLIDEQRTAYDGFYLFISLPPGTYSVRVDPARAASSGLVVEPSQPVSIGSEGTIISNIDLFATTTSTLALQRELALQNELTVERAIFLDALSRRPSVVLRRSDEEFRTVAGAEVLDEEVKEDAADGQMVQKEEIPPAPPAPNLPIHLASYPSLDSAEAAWADLAARHPSVLGPLEKSINKVDLGTAKGVYFRLSALTGMDAAGARSLCRELELRNQFCAVRSTSN